MEVPILRGHLDAEGAGGGRYSLPGHEVRKPHGAENHQDTDRPGE